MTVERAILAFAGFMVLLSLVLTYTVHANFVWLTVFVGANLLQSAFTGFCPAAIFMKKVMGLKTEAEKARAV
ncbi:YgaP family membrane protein [Rheinheimera sp.]|uniref:YgaP family membrane protein n=1 Tax=Rheinheimera sp. TaxID=1869214 RepID=UPI002FDD3B69